MNYLFIGYTDTGGKPVSELLLDTKKEQDNIYIYSDEPIYGLIKGIDFVKHDTFKDKSPDIVYLDVANYYTNSWLNVVNSWGCKEVHVLGE
jgi:hypothetical protein